MTETEFTAYLQAQIKAFNDYVWDFGIDTGMNLRDYFTENELLHIWITRYAKDFHDNYFSNGGADDTT